MRVIVWPQDNAGCGFYRLRYPAGALTAQGADIRVDHRGPMILWDRKWPGADDGLPPGPDVRAVGLERPVDADVVVCQRPTRRWWADIIPMLQAKGTRVVVDIDDMLDAIPKANVAKGAHERPHNNPGWADLACQRADVVTCSTPALAERYGYGKGVVLPNLVPGDYLRIEATVREHNIGWPGFVGTHPGDLESTEGAIAQATEAAGWKFHVVGDGGGVRQALRLRAEPTRTGPLLFGMYPYAVAELAIGIVPLAPGVFNEAKSALKASELAALGVPVVMSPTPDNLRLHALGVGLVAESRGQWKRLLGRLMASDDARAELAGKGREVMASQTYDLHADRWWSAWSQS